MLHCGAVSHLNCRSIGALIRHNGHIYRVLPLWKESTAGIENMALKQLQLPHWATPMKTSLVFTLIQKQV